MSRKERVCEGCPYYDAPGPVEPEGDPTTAELLIIGEAPGAEEAQAGRPFVGSSGRFLRATLRAQHVPLEQACITNVVLCRPPGNETPKKEAVEHCTKHFLNRLMQKFRGKRILLLGSVATEYVLGHKVTELNGYVEQDEKGRVIIPALHPAAVLRNPQDKDVWLMALRKFAKDVKPHDYTANIRLHPRYSELEEWVAKARGFGEVAFDFETQGEQQKPIAIAITTADASTVCVSWDDKVAAVLKPLFMDEHVLKVGYNIKFDAHVAHSYYGQPIAGQWVDVMRLVQLYDLPGKRGLGAVVPWFLDVPAWKPRANEEGLWLYNAKDALYTWMLWRTLKSRMERTKRWELWQRTKDLELVTYWMERRGFAIDVLRMRDLKLSLEEQLQQLHEQWESKFPGVNPRSPKAVLGLFHSLGIKLWQNNRGNETTEETYLRLTVSRDPKAAEVVDLLLRIRQLEKMLSTYLDYAPAVDGALHTRINLAGTISGRPSFSEPNLGNIPKDDEFGIRRIFVARPGYKLLSADWSQAEARVIAILGGEKSLLDAFNSGRDVHKMVASRIFQVPESSVTKEQRRLAKTILYGLSYGAGPRKVAENTGLSFKQAEQLIHGFRREFPNYAGILDEWNRRADELGSLTNPFGRSHSFTGERTATQSRNWIPQSTVADAMNIVLCQLYERFAGKDIHLLLQIYDQVIIEAATDLVEEAQGTLAEVMNQQWPELDGHVIPADVTVGDNWAGL